MNIHLIHVFWLTAIIIVCFLIIDGLNGNPLGAAGFISGIGSGIASIPLGVGHILDGIGNGLEAILTFVGEGLYYVIASLSPTSIIRNVLCALLGNEDACSCDCLSPQTPPVQPPQAYQWLNG